MRSWVLSVRVDRSGFDEADQAVGEDRCLRPGGQPDGQPPGGDVIDDAAAAVGVGDAVVDEALVQGQVGQRPVLRAAGSRRPAGRSGAAIGLDTSVAVFLGRCGPSCRW